MTVTFRCGHRVDVLPSFSVTPVCGCGERVVARVAGARPRFTGACAGPFAETRAVEPAVVNVAAGSPLKLKPPKE